MHPYSDTPSANGEESTMKNEELTDLENGASRSHTAHLDNQPPLPCIPPLPISSPTPSMPPKEPLRFPRSVLDLHFTLIGYEDNDVSRALPIIWYSVLD